jgi:hypothetical protein
MGSRVGGEARRFVSPSMDLTFACRAPEYLRSIVIEHKNIGSVHNACSPETRRRDVNARCAMQVSQILRTCHRRLQKVCVMTRARAVAAAMGLSVIACATSAFGGPQVYTYSVLHPIYGEIGTLTETINRSSETTRIDARLRIAVKLLGIVVSRQETDTTEILHADRLVSLQSVTEKDGQHFEVHGRIQGDQFVVNAMAASFAGPATIVPSDPWVLKRTGEQTVVFTDTGRITNTYISGGDYDTVSVNGASVSARHFIVMGDKRQEVWLDNREIPVMFRTVEDGTPIDFVLQNAMRALVPGAR